MINKKVWEIREKVGFTAESFNLFRKITTAGSMMFSLNNEMPYFLKPEIDSVIKGIIKLENKFFRQIGVDKKEYNRLLKQYRDTGK